MATSTGAPAMRQTGFVDARDGDSFVRTYRPDGRWVSDTASIDEVALERTDKEWLAAPAGQPPTSATDSAAGRLRPAPTNQEPIYEVEYDRALTAHVQPDGSAGAGDTTPAGMDAGLQYAAGSTLGWTRWFRDGVLVAEEVSGWVQERGTQSPPVAVTQATAYVEPPGGETAQVPELAHSSTGLDVRAALMQAAALGIGPNRTGSSIAPASLAQEPVRVSPAGHQPTSDALLSGPGDGVVARPASLPFAASGVLAVPLSRGMFGALAMGTAVLPGGAGALWAVVGRPLLFVLLAAVVFKVLEAVLADVLAQSGADTAEAPATDVTAPPRTDGIPRRTPEGLDEALVLRTIDLFKRGANAEQLTDSMARAAVRACLASGVAKQFPKALAPCGGDVRVLFIGGVDLPEHYAHVRDALKKQHPALLTRGPIPVPLRARDWYRSLPICKKASDDGRNCDEYPFASTNEGGEGASLRSVKRTESSIQGKVMSKFYAQTGPCGPFPTGTPFFVVPVAASISFGACRR